MGYRTEADFLDAVGREMAAMEVHSNRPGARPGQPSKQAAPGFRLQGKPESPERMRQVAHLVGPQNQHLLNEVGRRLGGEKIIAAVREAQAEPSRDNLGHVARLVAEFEDVHVARAAIAALRPTGYGDHFINALVDASAQVELAKEQRDEAAESRRLAERQQVIADEYRRVQHHPDASEAVDHLAHGLGDLLYDEQMSDDEARVMLRSQEAVARGQRKALDDFAFVTALEDEFRRYGPAGTDEHRDEYERGLREGALEIFDRANPTPEQAAAAAVDSVAYDKAFAEQPPLEVFLERELAIQAMHDSRAPHKVAMREANVADWEDRYDEMGRPRR